MGQDWGKSPVAEEEWRRVQIRIEPSFVQWVIVLGCAVGVGVVIGSWIGGLL